MDISIRRRRTFVDLKGDSLTVIHRPATVGHVEAWRVHLGAEPKPMTEDAGRAWLRDGTALAASILRDVVLSWDGVTNGGHPVTTEEATAGVIADWPVLRSVVRHIIESAELDAAVGKG